MSNPHLLTDEDFLADCREAALPDDAFAEFVSCEACGASVPEDDAVLCQDPSGTFWVCGGCFTPFLFERADQ